MSKLIYSANAMEGFGPLRSMREFNFAFFGNLNTKAIWFNPDIMEYMVIGEELCPVSNQSTIQGFVRFKRYLGWAAVMRILSVSNIFVEYSGYSFSECIR